MRSARIEIDGCETDYIIYEVGTIQNDRTFEWVEPLYTTGNGTKQYKSIDKMQELPEPKVQLIFRRQTYVFKLKELVAKYFLPNPHNFTQIGYIDKDYTNNSVHNLFWHNKGTLWVTRYTPAQIETVCQMIVSKQFTIKEITEHCKINSRTVYRLMYENYWPTIAHKYGLPYPKDEPETIWNEEIREKVKRLLIKSNYTIKAEEIADILDIPLTSHLRDRVKWTRYDLKKGRRTFNDYKNTDKKGAE